MPNENDYQEMPDPVQFDIESCVNHFSDADCLSLLEDILELEEVA